MSPLDRPGDWGLAKSPRLRRGGCVRAGNSLKSDAMLKFAVELQQRYENSVAQEHRKRRGQVFTPPEVARFMAGLFSSVPRDYHLLDPGAGVGTLTAAFCERVLKLRSPRTISAHLFENDPRLLPLLRRTWTIAVASSPRRGIRCGT